MANFSRKLTLSDFALRDQNESSSASEALGPLPEWNLADLYPAMDSEELNNDLKNGTDLCQTFAEKYKGKLEHIVQSEPMKLADALADYERIEDLLGRIISYAGLIYSGDTTDPQRAKFYGDVQEKITNVSTQLLFFALELNKISEADFSKLLGSKVVAHFHPWLEDLRKDKPFQLEDRVEELFHEKSITGRGAWNRLFDETMASLRFDINNEQVPLEPTLNFLVDKDGAVRKSASDALAATFKENIKTFTLITNTLAKDKEISDRWRGFEDVADSRHLANRVEREVVDALVATVQKAYPQLSHRYYALKAKWFGQDVLDHWDRNAPLPESAGAPIAWPDAQKIVLDAYAGFSPKMSDIASDFFDKNWIDAPTRTGKAPGAFAHPTVPSVHPYVLLNYQGKTRDVMTLAHELGHGVHQVLAGKQGALMAPTPLTLAETASVFGEMLTFRSLLERVKNPAERKILLAGKVEDMINTVVRQIAFYSFERKVHLARKEGELTSEQLCDIWMSIQADSLGPAIRLGDGYETFWTYIPHFIHSPFYVYAYAFGDCLVNSLYAVYQSGEAGFEEKYFEMLSAGGTKHHSELLAPFGLNAGDPAFWNKGVSVISGLIDELEAIEE
ncbi:MAG: M3 family oligoendopeptidase [Hyphomicrobiales bacterium]